MGGAHLPNKRTHRVGMLLHDWLDQRQPEGCAAMTSDQALNLGVLVALVAAIVALILGELLHRWKGRRR